MDVHLREYWNSLVKMSLSKFFVLRVLYTQPTHGYEIARAVAEMTNACCTPTEGTIYPMLREFEECGCVEVRKEEVNGRERKVYTLTEKGREAFEIAAETWQEATQYILEAAQVCQKA